MFEFINNTFRISIRQMVEFLYRKGDIHSGKGAIQSEKHMEAGSRIHRKIQKSMPVSYQAEVVLKSQIQADGYDITVEGRADGIDNGKELVLIDEIKGTYKNIEHMEEADSVHLAQALCYAWIYLTEHFLDKIQVQVTYCHMETEEIKRFKKIYTKDELNCWHEDLVRRLTKFTDLLYQIHKEGTGSTKNLSFPFSYRPGQREMTASVYYAIKEQKKLFVQAPTGVGKTMSTLFPAIRALGEEKASRIFYLTAKTITRTVAEESVKRLQKNGLKMAFTTITAKDKLCVCDKKDCNPAACSRAKGHFDRVNEALFEMVSKENCMDRDVILNYGEKYEVCPYELCLDASSFSNIIICDYNYALDPTVCLKRYFQNGKKGEYIFLIDEAHNLVDRTREMYSASLSKKEILYCKNLIKDLDKKSVARFNKVNRIMLEMKKENSGFFIYEETDSLYLSLVQLKTELDRFFEEDPVFEEKDRVLTLYFDLCRFIDVYENLDSCYKIYGETQEEDYFVKLFCIQPCKNLEQYLEKAVSTIFFSATILPVDYYKQILCGNKEEYAVYIPSPFENEKRALFIGSDVTSLYGRRNYEEYYKIYLHIIHAITAKKGNYIVFFPSYQYMEQVIDIMYEEGYPHEYNFLIQDSSMMEKEKEEFLKQFDESPVVAFCVLGGVFSEGIDLTGDKLIGAILVGTGLPQVSKERGMLKEYYDNLDEDGFAYAYLYPGMNKILQAAGRVIRTTEDEGIILLLDERFLKPYYQKMFPREWTDYTVINRNNSKEAMLDFWKKRKDS